MLIIKEYQRLTEEMAVIDSRIASSKRELYKLARRSGMPAGVSGIDYSAERVQGGLNRPELKDVVEKILELNISMTEDEAELNELRAQRAKLEEVIDSVGSTHKKVLMYKIGGCSHSKVAARLGCSKRHVERIYKEIRETLEISDDSDLKIYLLGEEKDQEAQ